MPNDLTRHPRLEGSNIAPLAMSVGLDRRDLLKGTAGLAATTLLPLPALAHQPRPPALLFYDYLHRGALLDDEDFDDGAAFVIPVLERAGFAVEARPGIDGHDGRGAGAIEVLASVAIVVAHCERDPWKDKASYLACRAARHDLAPVLIVRFGTWHRVAPRLSQTAIPVLHFDEIEVDPAPILAAVRADWLAEFTS